MTEIKTNQSHNNTHALRVLLLLSLLLPLFFLFDLLIGSYYISIGEIVKAIFHAENTDSQIMLIINQFRIPKAITAILAGAALSVAGLQMQTVFRNPLAGPDILGVSSGASLGVALLVLGTGGLLGGTMVSVASSWGIVAAAWIGSGLILLLIIMISSRIKEIMIILVLGILISSAILSVVNILQYFSNESMLK